MKIKFDSSQAYQLDAIHSIVDLFDGQPIANGDYSVQIDTSAESGFGSLFQSELGIGNNIVLDEEAWLRNLNAVQERSDLDLTSARQFRQNGLNFSVEMETGTGKTYVYLRTIFELSQKYGVKKFIIVVPSVPIREGTLKNIEITAEHFRSLYNNIEFEHFVYDSRKANRLRQFATSNQIQLMVINIDAFRKDFSDSESERKSNVIFKENDKLSGRKPIEFVQATQPIVIIDEPQSVDGTPRAQEAIKSLNPSCILRYSATHRNPYNLVYQLDPVKAYSLRLVKQIVVASVMGENAQNDAYVKLLDVDNRSGIRARLRIQVQAAGQVKEKDIWVKQNADLFALSNEREAYRHGFEVLDISAEPGNEFIDFTSGRLSIGQERGGIKDDLMQVQIRNTIKKHLDKELQLRGKGVKVLSLFFIDRVASYRDYDAHGSPQKGKFARLFEQYYHELIQLPQYHELDVYPVEKLHDGYFSQDKKGVYKDTTGSTQADDDTYAKIMRNKEQLLSLDEPLKFIFSHSALREGWDNPNVFQICTLNESRSAVKKRQEIGRGLRLPVDQTGERVFDNTVNKLTVIANESYDEFARKLQNEYETDCGVTFGKVPKTGFSRLVRLIGEQETPLGRSGSERIWAELVDSGMLDTNGKILPAFNPRQEGFTLGLSAEFEEVENEVITILQSYQIERHIKKDEEPRPLRINKRVYLDDDFKALWDRIKYKTTYQVDFNTEELVRNCVSAIRAMDKVQPATIVYKEAQLDVAVKGISVSETSVRYHNVQFTGALPDILAYLQKETELTRRTLVDILTKSERLQEFAINPQKFMDAVATIVRNELHQLMIDGIKYERIADQEWSMRLFEDSEIKSYLDSRLDVSKSVYDAIVYDSNVERMFAEALDKREDVKLFVKLPDWFKIETPIGTYNPDWAIVKHEDDTLYLVRETKDTHNYEKLRNSEAAKIRCGREHFKALGVDYKQIVLASEV